MLQTVLNRVTDAKLRLILKERTEMSNELVHARAELGGLRDRIGQLELQMKELQT